MKALVCEHCGGDEFIEKDGYRICRYCKSKFIVEKHEKETGTVKIDLNEDVERLLKRCKTDPARAKKYARLVLEIDPNNSDAKSYLRKK